MIPSKAFGITSVKHFVDRLSWKNTFAALKYRNYRLWFWSQMFSLFGSWMQTTAQGFFIFELTRSPAFLGYVGFAAGVPSWLFMLYGGVVADRNSRRRLLTITQSSLMVLAFILALLTLLRLVRPWHILILAFALGVVNAFDAPARHAFVSEMVTHEDLTNAIALNATMFNLATAIGPAIAGVTYAIFGPAWCFMINGISFFPVITALQFMKIPSQPKPDHRNSMQSDLKEGLHYIISEPIILTLVALVAMSSLFGVSFVTLIPAWAVTILRGNATTNGFLQSARGIGAFLGALTIASLGRFKFKGKLLTMGTFLFPTLLLIFSFIRLTPLALLVLLGIGAATIIIMNLSNALIQMLVPDMLRGRIMSAYSLTFFGFMPLGALWIGSVAEHVSEPAAVIIGSLVLLCFAILVWILMPQLRRLQ